MHLMIDNYDSFTFNVVQALATLGAEVEVVRNDALSVAEIVARRPASLIISPGPGRPADAGVSLAAIRELAGQVPILGVCLGHQCIVEVFGGEVVRADRVMHGKTSRIYNDGRTLYEGLSNPFEATRYHSLVIEPKTLPEELEVTAWTDDEGTRTIMGVRHRTWPLEGVQFHPESILTTCGKQLLANFLRLAAACAR